VACCVDNKFQSKGKKKRFQGTNNIHYRQVHILFLQTSPVMAEWCQAYLLAANENLNARRQWLNNNVANRGSLPPLLDSLDVWIRNEIDAAVARGEEINEVIWDISRGCNLEYTSYLAI
jgi:hypothetical protein